jgi:cytochrome P450 PksS
MAVDTVNLYKLWDQAARQNPHALYREIRAAQPVYRALGPATGRPFWFITRYEDCVTALKSSDYIKDSVKVLPPEEIEKYSNPMLEPISRHMLNVDPPDHTRLRGLVHKAFTPRMIENLRGRIEAVAEALLDDMQGETAVDLIDRYAFPLPIIVIADMLGIPADKRADFRRWTRALLFSGDSTEVTAAGLELIQYFVGVFEERRADPRDDLITALLHVEEAGDTLDQMELISMMFLLLAAGHETTVNLIGNGTLALLQHPDQKRLLMEDPGLIKTAVEEMLRYDGPVENALTRWAADDVELGGHTIQRGEMVMVALLSANRDPDAFAQPDTFDITRDPNRHIAFGGGIHYCLGAPLARMEGAIAIPALLRRYPNLALGVDAEALEWNNSIFFHGVRQLPVKLMT